MTLFADQENDFTGGSKFTECTYEFLQRSGQPRYVAVRKILDEWFSHYPEAHQHRLRRRFQNFKVEHQYKSAYFELVLHEWLHREGCEIVIEPPQENGKQPDFQVTGPTPFYLEAVVALDKSEEEQKTRRSSRRSTKP